MKHDVDWEGLWDATTRELVGLKGTISNLHEVDKHDPNLLELRRRCIDLHYLRIDLVKRVKDNANRHNKG